MKSQYSRLQYSPVIRWKSSEREALRNLDGLVKDKIAPIIEFVPKEFEKNAMEITLKTQTKHIATNWGWNRHFFIDFHLLGENRATHCIPLFKNYANSYALSAVFVTGLNQSANFCAALKNAIKGVAPELCFRINAYELRQVGFQQALTQLLSFYGVKFSNAHLVIDFQNINFPLPQIGAFVNSIPNLDDWKSFTILSGAFPKDLSNLEKNNQYELPRHDWAIWCEHVFETKQRVPSFGDYAIQHGVFEEHEGKHFNFSASLRYTAAEYWVIMRGEGVMNEDGAGFEQFPAQAQLLLERSEFCGAGYCAGDKYIHEMGQQMLKTGQAKEWLVATFNHHLTFVIRQLEHLVASEGNGALLPESIPSLPVGKA